MELRDDDADIIVLMDETGVPPEAKEEIRSLLVDRIGMHQDEKYGTLAFFGSLDLLNNITEATVRVIERYQMDGKIFPALRRDVVDREFRDRLLRYAVFRMFWHVDEERSVILTYDINHKLGNRNAKRYYTLKRVAALKIFNSCYWIPEDKINIVSNAFLQFVTESRANPKRDKTGNVINYHYRIFRCYAIGSADGLKRWKDMQLGLLMEKITSLQARTREKTSYFSYVNVAWDAMDDDERSVALQRVKKLRYWKSEAINELRPYLNVHIHRMESMGIAHQMVTRTETAKVYNERGVSTVEEMRFNTNIEQGLARLMETINELHTAVHPFVVNAVRNARQRSVSSDQFGA